MLEDVLSACAAVGETIVADTEGQGQAVATALRSLKGLVAIVNADLPCATPDDVETLLAAAPALVAATDGTTNALALADPAAFRPLYGPRSATRFGALGLRRLELPNLADDVDTLADLDRVATRAGPRTRAVLELVRVPL
jgi:2-phospho-L-lactate guanylyltransferase (CobY/MobA/RfbA family)